jgi:hypothetical protein
LTAICAIPPLKLILGGLEMSLVLALLASEC